MAAEGGGRKKGPLASRNSPGTPFPQALFTKKCTAMSGRNVNKLNYSADLAKRYGFLNGNLKEFSGAKTPCFCGLYISVEFSFQNLK